MKKFLASPPFIVFIVTLVVNLFIAWLYFSTYRFWNFDLAVLAQVAQSYAELREPTMPIIEDGFKALGNHFSPIIALTAPFYALFPYTFTLNVVMVFCFALTAAILTSSAAKRVSAPYAYLIGIGLGISFGFIGSSTLGFHEYALGAPILAYALGKFLDKAYLTSSLAAGLLVFVKEDVGLMLIAFGVVIALKAKQWRWLALSCWGILWVVLSIKVIIPAISGEWDFSGFVSLTPETLFTDASVKIFLILFLCLQAGVIGVRSPLFLLLIPLVAARLFTSWSVFYLIGYHYDTLTVIVASFALLDSLTRKEWSKRIKLAAVSVPVVLGILFTIVPPPGVSSSIFTRDYSRDSEVIADYEAAYSVIPDGSAVAASDTAVAGSLDRGFDTYFIRTSIGRASAPDCLMNESSSITGADGNPYLTVGAIGEAYGLSYELVYDGAYIKTWCSSGEDR